MKLAVLVYMEESHIWGFILPSFFFSGEGALLLWENGQLAANESVWEAVPVLVRVQLLRDVVRTDRLRVGERRLREDVDGGVSEAELGDGVEVEALAAHVEAAGGAVEDVLLAKLCLRSNGLVYLRSSNHAVIPGNIDFERNAIKDRFNVTSVSSDQKAACCRCGSLPKSTFAETRPDSPGQLS